MNVKNLKKLLEKLPDEMEVILAKDSEGNRFSPLSDYYSIGYYFPANTWSGDFTGRKDEEDGQPPYQDCDAICLTPTN